MGCQQTRRWQLGVQNEKNNGTSSIIESSSQSPSRILWHLKKDPLLVMACGLSLSTHRSCPAWELRNFHRNLIGEVRGCLAFAWPEILKTEAWCFSNEKQTYFVTIQEVESEILRGYCYALSVSGRHPRAQKLLTNHWDHQLLVVTLLPSWITWLPEGHPATVMSVWSLPGAPNPPIASWKFQGFCC